MIVTLHSCHFFKVINQACLLTGQSHRLDKLCVKKVTKSENIKLPKLFTEQVLDEALSIYVHVSVIILQYVLKSGFTAFLHKINI